MYSRKFKTVSLILLTTVYLITSCFFSVSFASANSVGYDNIEDGMYHIQNCENDLYITDLDYFSAILSGYIPNATQRWEFIYVSDGYYNIKNSNNGRYLTAPSDAYEGSLVEQKILSSSYTDNQLWAITPAYYGSNTYYLQAKSQENYNLYLASSDTLGVYGYDLIQSELSGDYRCEWILEDVIEATIVGINYNSGYTSTVTSVKYDFENAGYITTALTPTSITVVAIKSYMKNSDIFILRSNGYYDNLGTYMWLNTTSTLPYLHAWDIYNYNGNNGIDLSKCNIAVFAGCYTSYWSNSLPQAAVDAGAQYGIGFAEDPTNEQLNTWTQVFASAYTMEEDVYDATYTAIKSAGDGYSINTMEIITQGG